MHLVNNFFLSHLIARKDLLILIFCSAVLSLTGCTIAGEKPKRPSAPSYARFDGASYTVYCNLKIITIDYYSTEQFYNEDGTAMDLMTFCDQHRTTLIKKR